MERIHYYFFCLYNLFYKDGFAFQEKTSSRALPIEQRVIAYFASVHGFGQYSQDLFLLPRFTLLTMHWL
jgi:hypothetical protein